MRDNYVMTVLEAPAERVDAMGDAPPIRVEVPKAAVDAVGRCPSGSVDRAVLARLLEPDVYGTSVDVALIAKLTGIHPSEIIPALCRLSVGRPSDFGVPLVAGAGDLGFHVSRGPDGWLTPWDAFQHGMGPQ